MATTSQLLFSGQDTLWSPDRAYRYFLRRSVEHDFELSAKPPIAFLLLNPSTADEMKDDPTVARCRRFALAWGYGEVIVLNAFAFRATDPRNMKAQADPVGPENDAVIIETTRVLFEFGGTLVCGWGNHGAHHNRGTAIREVIRAYPARAFPLTKVGEPGHPLYLRNDVQLRDLPRD